MAIKRLISRYRAVLKLVAISCCAYLLCHFVLTYDADYDSGGVKCDALNTSFWQKPRLHKHFKDALNSKAISDRAENCNTYFDKYKGLVLDDPGGKQHFHYGENSTGEVHVAFSVLVHDSVGIFETLLHLIFRQHHTYCIHVDRKSPPSIQQSVAGVVKCFQEKFKSDNIFLAKFPYPVYWGDVSMLNADLLCMEQLLNRNSDWQYYFNLAGSELPLVPVEEITRRLALNPQYAGVESYSIKDAVNRERFLYSFALGASQSFFSEYYPVYPKSTQNLKSKPPFNLTIYKGSKNILASRKFVKFLLYHPVAKHMLRWSSDMMIPDESFYATLSRISSIEPRTYTNATDENVEKIFKVVQNKMDHRIGHASKMCPRLSLWSPPRCHGRVIRFICNIGLYDLPYLYKEGNNECMFVNKFNLDVDPLAVICQANHVVNSLQ